MKKYLDNKSDVSVKASYGETPLHRASTHGRIQVVATLLDYGANVNDKDDEGDILLHYALNNSRSSGENASISMAGILLSRGAHIDSKNTLGTTPLDNISSSMHSLLRFLQNYKAKASCP